MIEVRKIFDNYNLISALHTFMSLKDKKFKNLLPPLVLVNTKEKKDLINSLYNLKFISEKDIAA